MGLLASVVLLLPGCRRVEDDRPPPVDAMTRADAADPAAVAARESGATTMVVPDFAKVAARVGPSVVTVISTVRDRESGRRNKVVRGLGSGMIVSVGGHVLTNEHVVASATRVDVELSSHARIPANVVVAEPMLDLALLELEAPVDGLAPVELSEHEPTPGEWIMAVGQPFGLGHTVTVGVISGLRRDYDDLGRPDGLRPDGIWSFIQTDASINIGNSGGPLVDPEGRVVGITTAVRSDGQGVAFAIPAPMVRHFLDEVWKYERVREARLGIKADNAITDEVAGRSAVVRITQVDPGGPGEKAGLQEGDYILSMAEVAVDRVSDVAYLTQLAGVGARVTMTIQRQDRQPEQVLVIPAEIK